MKTLTTEQILQAYAGTGLSDKAAITLQVAYEKRVNGQVCTGLNHRTVKAEMPDLLKYILPDPLKFSGVIVLNRKGIELTNSINQKIEP